LAAGYFAERNPQSLYPGNIPSPEREKGKRMYLLSAERCSHVQELILRLRVITAWKKVNKEGRGVGRSKT